MKKDVKVEKHKKRLAIINDYQYLSGFLERLLKKYGFDQVHSFADVKVSMEYLLTNPTDFVIIDTMFPVMRTRDNENGDVFHPYILMDNQTPLKTVKQICKLCPDAKVLILTGERHPHTFQLFFDVGNHGIAGGIDSLASFLIILQRIMAGEDMTLKYSITVYSTD